MKSFHLTILKKNRPIIGLLILSGVIIFLNLSIVDERVALEGWGIHEYISKKTNPEIYLNDWPNGITNLDQSIVMRGFYLLAKSGLIKLDRLVAVFIICQTLLFVMVAYKLGNLIANDKQIAFGFSAILLISAVIGRNFANFGHGYQGMFGATSPWIFSISFGYFAIFFYFKDRKVMGSVFLLLAVFTHSTLGLTFLVFICPFYLLELKQEFKEPKNWISIILLILGLVPLILIQFTAAQSSMSGIREEAWIKCIRIFSFHSFPVALKSFSSGANRELLPLIFLNFSFFFSLRYINFGSNEKRILFGSFACYLVTLIGIVFSEIFPIPFFIKLQLPRSIHIVTFFGTLYLIIYLFKKVERNLFWITVVCMLSFMILCFSNPGLAVFPLIVLWSTDIAENRLGPINLTRFDNRIIMIVATFAFAIGIFLIGHSWGPLGRFTHLDLSGIWEGFSLFNPQRRIDMLLKGGEYRIKNHIFFILTVGSLCIAYLVRFSKHKKPICIVIVIILVTVGKYNVVKEWQVKNGDRAKHFIDAQLWAKYNTDPDSVFLTDPSTETGWRSFSERSSFGNIREWLFISIYYTANTKLFEEGKRRSAEFGVDIDSISETDMRVKSGIFGQVLSKKVAEYFYKMRIDKVKELSSKYKIDYIVFAKKRGVPQLQLQVAYENKAYLIYSM